MSVDFQRRLLFLSIGLILAGLIFLVGLAAPARADVGVHPVLPGGSSIEPEGDTPVQMASERVTMDVRLATADDNAILELNPAAYGLNLHPVWYPAVASVVADFTMFNPTTSTVNLTTWFPLASALDSVSWELNPDETVPAIASFQVTQDGVPLEFTTSQLPNPRGADKPPLPWASFVVPYPPGAETHLQVSYLLPLTQAIKGRELLLYYIFQTGAGWAGPIGQAELVLHLPYPASSATFARVSPDQLGIPYPMAYPGAVIPSTGVIDDDQVSWTWTDFEPTAQDDFAVWLVDPVLIQELEQAQTGVQADPQSGQAWLDLALIYHQLATRSYSRPSIFLDSYLTPGIEAYQKAIDLWPENPTPHTGIALLTLVQYLADGKVPPEAMQFINEQIQIAEALEIQHPDLVEAGGLPSIWARDALGYYFYSITATSDAGASLTASARLTQTATVEVPTTTPTPLPSRTPSPSPTHSPQPPSSGPTRPAVTASEDFFGRQLSVVVILFTLIFTLFIGLIIFGILLVLKSRRGE